MLQKYFAVLSILVGFSTVILAGQDIPNMMSECEGTGACGVWTFNGTQGTAQWPYGAVANLTVKRFDSDSVVIQRTDPSGSSAGLTAVYTGKIHGSRIDGSVM